MSYATHHDVEDAFNTARHEFLKELASLRGDRPKVMDHPAKFASYEQRLTIVEAAITELFETVDMLIHGGKTR